MKTIIIEMPALCMLNDATKILVRQLVKIGIYLIRLGMTIFSLPVLLTCLLFGRMGRHTALELLGIIWGVK